jgi:hypothetical protein
LGSSSGGSCSPGASDQSLGQPGKAGNEFGTLTTEQDVKRIRVSSCELSY